MPLGRINRILPRFQARNIDSWTPELITTFDNQLSVYFTSTSTRLKIPRIHVHLMMYSRFTRDNLVGCLLTSYTRKDAYLAIVQTRVRGLYKSQTSWFERSEDGLGFIPSPYQMNLVDDCDNSPDFLDDVDFVGVLDFWQSSAENVVGSVSQFLPYRIATDDYTSQQSGISFFAKGFWNANITPL